MSKSREQRIDDALTQLVRLSIPGLNAESEDRAHELYEDACNKARGFLETDVNETPTVHDVDQVADQIKRKRGLTVSFCYHVIKH